MRMHWSPLTSDWGTHPKHHNHNSNSQRTVQIDNFSFGIRRICHHVSHPGPGPSLCTACNVQCTYMSYKFLTVDILLASSLGFPWGIRLEFPSIKQTWLPATISYTVNVDLASNILVCPFKTEKYSVFKVFLYPLNKV